MGSVEPRRGRGSRRHGPLLLGFLGLGAVTLGLLVGPADINIPGVLTLRLGRTLLGLLTGAALGAAGATLQGLTRNPLADPYLTGVSAGAGVGVALAALLGIGGLTTLGFLGRQALGFLGGIGAALLVWRLTGRRRGDSTGLIVAGVVTNAGLSGVILIILAWLPLWSQGAVLGWLMGDLASPYLDWGPLILAAGLIAACLVYLLTRSRELDALALGERCAHSLGVDIDRARGGTLLAAALATATAVTLAGIIPFVGLVAPHLVRVRLGADHRRLLPSSALVGAVLVVLADNAVRLAVCYLGLPGLPVGAALALIGGPYFFIIYRRRSVNS